MVAGTYGPKAKKVYDSLSASNSNFGHPQILHKVERAAKLASLARDDSRFSGQFRGQGRGRGPWRGRGQFPHRGRGRGVFQQDYNPGFQPVNIAMDREETN